MSLNINKNILNLSNIGITLCTICCLSTGIIAYRNSRPKQIDLDTPIRGCDISSHQVYTNWDEMYKNYDFVIIKASSGNEVDSKFEENYNNAKKNHIDVGIYTHNAMSTVNSNSLEEFTKGTNERIDLLLDNLRDKRINYPVYLDIEFSKTPIDKALPKEYANALINTFYNKMIDNGYIPGIYSNYSTYNYLKSNVDNIDKLEIWLAGGDTYDTVTSLEKADSNNKLFSDDVKMVQSYQYAVNGGAGDSLGHLDVDYSNIDYYHKEIDYKDYGIAAGSLAVGTLILYKKRH